MISGLCHLSLFSSQVANNSELVLDQPSSGGNMVLTQGPPLSEHVVALVVFFAEYKNSH